MLINICHSFVTSVGVNSYLLFVCQFSWCLSIFQLVLINIYHLFTISVGVVSLFLIYLPVQVVLIHSFHLFITCVLLINAHRKDIGRYLQFIQSMAILLVNGYLVK